MLMREGPLVEIRDREEFEAWLRTQRRDVAVTFAARAALRVFPLVQTAKRAGYETDLLSDVVLPVFRATAVSWAAAKYPARETELTSARAFAARAGSVVHTAITHAANADLAHSSLSGSARAGSALTGSVPRSFTAAFAAADSALAAAAGVDASTIDFALAAADTAADAAFAADAVAAFWSAISTDATLVEKGAMASDIAGSQLWPQLLLGPGPLQSLWHEMESCASRHEARLGRVD